MASFTRTFDKPVRISTGYVGVGNKTYAEVWNIAPHKYELRILIRKPKDIAYRDMLWNTTYKYRISGSFACVEIPISGNYYVDMVGIEHAEMYLAINDIPNWRKKQHDSKMYVNNKGIYPSVWSY